MVTGLEGQQSNGKFRLIFFLHDMVKTPSILLAVKIDVVSFGLFFTKKFYPYPLVHDG